MKSNKKQVIINNILTFIQFLIFVPSILLEYLSKEKMGVTRYLVFKKKSYEQTFFDSYYMNLYKLILIIGIIICFILLIYNYTKIKDGKAIKSIIFAIALSLLGIIFMISKQAVLLEAYHFFLISIFITIGLQYIRILAYYLIKK